MQKAELMLCLGMSPLRCFPEIGSRIGKVGEDALPARIELAQPKQRLGITGVGKQRPFSECGGVVPALTGDNTSLSRGLRTAPPETAEIDHGSRIASPTPRITPRQMYMKAERVPTWMSAVRVIPGTSRKPSGTDLRLTSVKAMRAL